MFCQSDMLLQRVRQFARRHSLWHAKTRLVVAVSGGSDSVALLRLLFDLHSANELRLDAVAHLNHMIRGDAAGEDERFCRILAERLGVPFVTASEDVPRLARERRVSVEVAARDARREFLGRVRRQRGADAVATAHTRDDQAETVLLRLMRGTSLRGLAGIAPSRDGWIRPLLDCSRDELVVDLESRGQRWREDATNADVSIPRNRVRHELLPYLRREFNPSATLALARLADHAREDESFLAREASDASRLTVDLGDLSVRIDRAALNALPDALARRVLTKAVEHLGAPSLTLDHVERMQEVARGARAAHQFFGIRVEHSGPSVVLINSGSVSPPPAFRFDLPIPGTVELAAAGWTLQAEGPITREQGSAEAPSLERVTVEAADLGAALVVRSRRPGDRLRPVGSAGRKKVQDVFVDRKVNRADRDRVPIVTAADGRIVWVAGHALDEAFRVTDRTKAVVVLKLRRI